MKFLFLARRRWHFPQVSRQAVAALGVGVMIFVSLIVWESLRATGNFAASETESGSVAGNASVVADAGASGGRAIQFNAPPSLNGGCASGVTGSSPACTLVPPAPAASGKHWDVSFSEEFNGTDYDHSKLTPCFDWNYGDCTASFNAGYERYAPSQVTVSGGAAHLLAAPLSPPYANSACYNGSCTYKSGLLATSRLSGNDPASSYLYSFTYGYAEANIKVLNQQGFFAAWWMLPADPSYTYTYNGHRYEIDIMEALGSDPTDMEMHYSWGSGPDYYTPNSGSPLTNGACAAIDYSQAFHRFGVDWEPGWVAFYIDGTKCGQIDASSSVLISNVPMQLIVNQMVSNDWQRSVNKPLLDTTLTSDMQIDYMRVYQQTAN